MLGVTQAMNNLVSGKAGISAEMAIRLEKDFGGGAETWLRAQAAYDLAQVEKHVGKIKVQRVKDALIPVCPHRSKDCAAPCMSEYGQLQEMCDCKT